MDLHLHLPHRDFLLGKNQNRKEKVLNEPQFFLQIDHDSNSVLVDQLRQQRHQDSCGDTAQNPKSIYLTTLHDNLIFYLTCHDLNNDLTGQLLQP